MNFLRRIALTILFLPLAELVVFILAAVAVGFWSAFLTMLGTMAAGAILLRLAGRAQVIRLRNTQGITFTADENGRSLALVLAGILLLVPGFITDVVALFILLPMTRRRIGTFVGDFVAQAAGRADGGAPVVDLDPDEWERHTPPPAQSDPRRTPPTIDHRPQD